MAVQSLQDSHHVVAVFWPMACEVQSVRRHGVLQAGRPQQEAVQALNGGRYELVELDPKVLETLKLLGIVANVEPHKIDRARQQPRHSRQEEQLRHGLEGGVQRVAVRAVHQEDAINGFWEKAGVLEGALYSR